MIPLLLYAQALDLATFLVAESTLGFEGNEYGFLANAIYEGGGVMAIALLKVLIVALIAITIVALPERASFIKRFAALFAIVFGTLGTLTNVASLAVSV